NPDLSEAARISPGHGLPSGKVHELFVDRQGNIWCAVSGQLVRIESPRALTRFDRFNGLDTSAVHALARHDGALYAGTSGGIYRLDPGTSADAPARFHLLPGPRNLTPVLLAHGGQLLAGSADGIYVLRDERFTLIARTPGQVLCLSPSAHDTDRIYFGLTGGSGLLQWAGNRWETRGISLNPGIIRGVLEIGPDEWWTIAPEAVNRYRVAPPAFPSPEQGTFSTMFLSVFGQSVIYVSQPHLNPWLRGDRTPRLTWWHDTPLLVGA